MVTDGVIRIEETKPEELSAIYEMEQDAGTARYICGNTLQKHQEEYGKAHVLYRSIYHCDKRFVGFLVLILDADGTSVELRRIVISEKGRGFGTRAVSLVDGIVTGELGRSRIWLDVFDFNHRGRHVYEHRGYKLVSMSTLQGKALCIYEKWM